MRGGVGVVAIDVDGVERLDDFTAGHPARDDIGGMDGIGIGRIGMRTIGMAAVVWRGGGGLVGLGHAPDGGPNGRVGRVAMTPLLLNRAGSHRGKAQSWLAMPHQELAQAYDAPPAPGRELIGMMVRRTGSRAEAGPRMVGAIVYPFVDPATAAVESACHFGGRGAGMVEFHRHAATLGVFVI